MLGTQVWCSTLMIHLSLLRQVVLLLELQILRVFFKN